MRKEKHQDKDTKTLKQRCVGDCHSGRYLNKDIIRRPQERHIGDCCRGRYHDSGT